MKAKKQKFRKKSGGLTVTIVGLAALLYFLVQVAGSLKGQVETVAVTRVTANDYFSVDGFFWRDEIIVPGAVGGTVEHLVSTGDKVQKSESLIVSYSDENDLASKIALREIADRRAQLTSALQSAGDFSDTSKLDQVIVSDMKQLCQQIKNGAISGVAEKAHSLRDVSLRRNAGALSTQEIQSAISSLDDQKADLEKQISGRTDRIVAPVTGYYADTVDGYETLLTSQALQQLTYEKQEKLRSSPPDAIPSSLGKIVRGFSWYYSAAISATDARRVKKGQSVKLRVAQTGDTIEVVVYDIRRSQDGKNCLLILRGDTFTADIVTMRQQPADVIISTYSGLKIPKEAVRMVQQEIKNPDGTTSSEKITGVYILSGSIAKFKNIEPVFETEKFFVIRQSSGEDAGIVMQDPLIIRGKGIEDKKVIK